MTTTHPVQLRYFASLRESLDSDVTMIRQIADYIIGGVGTEFFDVRQNTEVPEFVDGVVEALRGLYTGFVEPLREGDVAQQCIKLHAREILEQFDCVDYVVKGDSEEPTLALIEHLLRGRGSLEDVPNVSFRAGAAAVDRRISYRRRDLEGLDFVSSAFLEHREHYYFTAANGIQRAKPSNFWLSVARGCSFECEYCSGSRRNNDPLFGSPAVVKRSPEALARDILRLARMGVRTLLLTQSIETLGQMSWIAASPMRSPTFAAAASSGAPGTSRCSRRCARARRARACTTSASSSPSHSSSRACTRPSTRATRPWCCRRCAPTNACGAPTARASRTRATSRPSTGWPSARSRSSCSTR